MKLIFVSENASEAARKAASTEPYAWRLGRS